ncbi:MAG: hypothetical protein WA843_00305, partial [Candidatus Saccharimonadales bacterium]
MDTSYTRNVIKVSAPAFIFVLLDSSVRTRIRKIKVVDKETGVKRAGAAEATKKSGRSAPASSSFYSRNQYDRANNHTYGACDLYKSADDVTPTR